MVAITQILCMEMSKFEGLSFVCVRPSMDVGFLIQEEGFFQHAHVSHEIRNFYDYIMSCFIFSSLAYKP